MPKVVVASENPVKREAARQAFLRAFPNLEWQFDALAVVSGVADQPMTSEETLQGAHNRAQAIRQQIPNADYWVGIEGGLEERAGELEAFAWAVVVSPSKEGKGKTSSFFLPEKVAQLIREGNELATATDIIFETTNARHSIGAVGALTQGHIDRATFNAEAVLMALIPFLNDQLY